MVHFHCTLSLYTVTVQCHCTPSMYTVNAVTVYCHCTCYTVFWQCTLSLHTAHCHCTLPQYTVTIHCHCTLYIVHCTLYSVHCTPQGLIECISTHNTSATTLDSILALYTVTLHSLYALFVHCHCTLSVYAVTANLFFFGRGWMEI